MAGQRIMEHLFNHQVVQDDALPGIYRCLAVMTRRGLIISVGLVYTLRTVSIFCIGITGVLSAQFGTAYFALYSQMMSVDLEYVQRGTHHIYIYIYNLCPLPKWMYSKSDLNIAN